ncbi:MAG: YidC/Oxa1 family membrane protein insertase [Oscillospiraceae bacterium]|nr:YidC/Oxa1 family membrane protein insertase [Oscillospiraceae bacterium]
MWLVYKLVKNYGIAILIFTVLTRLITFPLSVQQQKSMAATSAINPKLERLKKQYANNQQKLQEEQMKLYSEEGINPMASCLPMLIQLILLWGVFDVIYRPISYIIRLNKETLETLKNVAAPLFEGNAAFNARPELYLLQSVQSDPNYYLNNGISADVVNSILEFQNKIFGVVDLGVIPKTVFDNGLDKIVFSPANVGLMLIPIIAGLLQLATSIYSTAKQKKMNPDAADQMKSMNLMLYFMPLFSVYIGFTYASGLGFYWICSSLVGIIQNVVLNRIYTPEYVQKLIEKDKLKNKNKKRSGIMEKYNEMMKEQLAAAQNEGKESAKVEKIPAEGRLSNSQMKDYERRIIAEARRRQAEKYGDDPDDDSE